MQSLLIIKREKEKVTKSKLAEILGITAKQYTKKERGEVCFTGDEMFKIADYFNSDVKDIFLPRK